MLSRDGMKLVPQLCLYACVIDIGCLIETCYVYMQNQYLMTTWSICCGSSLQMSPDGYVMPWLHQACLRHTIFYINFDYSLFGYLLYKLRFVPVFNTYQSSYYPNVFDITLFWYLFILVVIDMIMEINCFSSDLPPGVCLPFPLFSLFIKWLKHVAIDDYSSLLFLATLYIS